MDTSNYLPQTRATAWHLKSNFFLPHLFLLTFDLLASHFDGFWIHIKRPSTQPAQYFKTTLLTEEKLFAIIYCVSWLDGFSMFDSSRLFTASTITRTLLITSVNKKLHHHIICWHSSFFHSAQASQTLDWIYPEEN